MRCADEVAAIIDAIVMDSLAIFITHIHRVSVLIQVSVAIPQREISIAMSLKVAIVILVSVVAHDHTSAAFNRGAVWDLLWVWGRNVGYGLGEVLEWDGGLR